MTGRVAYSPERPVVPTPAVEAMFALIYGTATAALADRERGK